MSSDLLLASLSQLGARLPVLLAYGVAAFLALARWNRHPRVSMLVVTGVGILAIELLVGVVMATALPAYLRDSGRSVSQVGLVYTAWGVANSLVTAGAWGLVITAIFSGRGDAAPSPDA